MQAMVLSVIGKDKPGLVDELAKAVKQVNGNWLRSSFCHLSGHFAGFVEIMLPKEMHNKLVEQCHTISSLQITLLPAHVESPESSVEINIKVTGNDRQGIVSDVTGALKTFDLNITELQTSCDSAPNWGSLLFTANIKIHAPENFDAAKIIEAIESIADDLIVDLRLD